MNTAKFILYWLACGLLVAAIAGLICLHYLPGWTDVRSERDPRPTRMR